jgi:hypothetical protein
MYNPVNIHIYLQMHTLNCTHIHIHTYIYSCIYIGAFSGFFPKSVIYVQPGQYAFPIDLPTAFFYPIGKVYIYKCIHIFTYVWVIFYECIHIYMNFYIDIYVWYIYMYIHLSNMHSRLICRQLFFIQLERYVFQHWRVYIRWSLWIYTYIYISIYVYIQYAFPIDLPTAFFYSIGKVNILTYAFICICMYMFT